MTHQVFELLCLANDVTYLETHVKEIPIDYVIDLCSLNTVLNCSLNTEQSNACRPKGTINP